MSIRRIGLTHLASLLAICLGGAVANAASSTEAIRFNRDIRPILSDNCFRCHGPDKANRKGKLRLDIREEALERKAFVPGQPAESELVSRIFTTNEDDLMPPPDSTKHLTPEQKELLKKWIAQGAEYEPHWSYIPPVRSPSPSVKNKKWVRNPIDAFVLHELETRDIKPSKEADKRTLLRRLSLDLIGLPPTPEEVEAFLKDKDARAYERAVERLLASEHFGERMAVPWLDIVRFSDTVGYHGDQNQNVFPYRDYVINAFNKNKRFDQFTIEQLAGDLLPNPTVEQRVATGFNRLNMMTREGGAQPKEYLAKYAADRVRTVSTTWLGSTMACAECHDHKYDPISTKDFYQLSAFFADVKQWGVYMDYGYTPNPDLRGWSNDHPFPPEIDVESPYLMRRIERFQQRIDELVRASTTKIAVSAEQRRALQDWLRFASEFVKANPSGWVTPNPEGKANVKGANPPAQATVEVQPDRSVIFVEKDLESLKVTVPLTAGWVSAIRLEMLPDERHGQSIVRGGGQNTAFSLSASLKAKDQEQETKLAFFHADADRKLERYANGYPILGIKDSWRTKSDDRGKQHTGVWLLDRPMRVNDGDQLIVSLGSSGAGRVRISLTPFAAQNPVDSGASDALRRHLEAGFDTLGATDRASLIQAYFRSVGGTDSEIFSEYKKLHREILECRNGRSPTMVTEAWEPVTTRVLARGNFLDEKGEVVQPLVPHFLKQVENPESRRLNRLDLAKWLVSRDNPLTARTVVNRFWKQFFGAGICSTVDDLGLQGDSPSHPELLDWLAVEFMESGWDVKHVVRLIVTSATYRQDANLRPDLREIDPNNRLLASQNPRRLEAEFVRDNALAIAGLLNTEVGGPSAFPYQPPGYYVNIQFPDRDYYPNRDERQYRRGVYAHWQRTFLQPMMANFDAPSREECTAFRIVSNTPQQALTLLNDPTFFEAARVFAERLLTSNASSDEARLELAFQRTLARPVKKNEKESLLKFLAEQREHYRSDKEEMGKQVRVGIAPPASEKIDPVEMAAWTQVCRVVFNLHETITCY